MKGRKVNGKVTHLESFALASNVVAELAKLEEELEVIGFPFLMAGGKVAESPIRFVLRSLSWETPPTHTPGRPGTHGRPEEKEEKNNIEVSEDTALV